MKKNIICLNVSFLRIVLMITVLLATIIIHYTAPGVLAGLPGDIRVKYPIMIFPMIIGLKAIEHRGIKNITIFETLCLGVGIAYFGSIIDFYSLPL